MKTTEFEVDVLTSASAEMGLICAWGQPLVFSGIGRYSGPGEAIGTQLSGASERPVPISSGAFGILSADTAKT